MSSPAKSAAKACSSWLYGRKVHTTIMTASYARTPLRPLKLETRLHPPTPSLSAAEWHCSASLPPQETTSSLCPMALSLFPKCVPASAEWWAHRRQRPVATAPHGRRVCLHRRATLLDWSLRVHSGSIELGVSLSTSANTPAKSGSIPVHISSRPLKAVLPHGVVPDDMHHCASAS